MAEVNLNEGVNALAQQKINNKAFLAGQNDLTSGFLTKFGNTITGQGTSADAAARFGEEVGLPTLQKNAFNLNEQVLGIPALHTSATRGFDVNANQLGRIINTETARLAPLAQEATRSAQFAENSVNTRLGYLQNDWNRQLLPLNTEKDFLVDRAARETAMYSQENQDEFNVILDKIKNNVALSMQEKDLASKYAIAERGYENELEKQKLANNKPFAVGRSDIGIFKPGSDDFWKGSWT